MGVERSFKVGDEVPPLVKEMTQEAINLFEVKRESRGEHGHTEVLVRTKKSSRSGRKR